jgi:hypothetical protein
MNNIVFSNVELTEIEKNSYDIYLTALGYEKRCTYFSSTYKPLADNKHAFSFDFGKDFSFEENKEWFSNQKYDVTECTDEIFINELKILLDGTNNLKVLVDVSSFSRLRIAIIMRELNFAANNKEIMTDFVYSLAKFTPPVNSSVLISNASPILPDFAGWPKDPIIPSSCIIGLGYDEGRAIGAIEYLEAGKVWLLRPIGVDDKFLEAINENNSDLLERVSPSQIIDYNLLDPIGSYIRLHSLVEGAIKNTRPVILPFGPKIFTVLTMATAMNFYPDLSVWRISSGQSEPPVDREACGEISCIHFNFTKT